jgi:hypothetical protein
MTHCKFRTRFVTTLAALTFPALALAQGSGSSSQGSSSPAPGNADQSADQSGSARGNSNQGSNHQGSNHQGGSAQGSPTQPPHAGQPQGSSTRQGSATGTQNRAGDSMQATDPSMGSSAMNAGGSSQAMIDPTQIQKVFGSDATLVDLKSLGPDETRRLQQSLKDRGLYQGTVDGMFGPQTRAALSALISQQYSLNQRLINQGQITGPVATSIGLDTQGVAPVSGRDLSAPRQQQPMPQNAGQPPRQQAPQDRNSPTYPQAPQTGEPDMQPAPQNPR